MARLQLVASVSFLLEPVVLELGQQSQTNTIMLVPAVMPEAGWPPVGTYGFKDLTKMQQENAAVKKKTPPRPEPLPPAPEEQAPE